MKRYNLALLPLTIGSQAVHLAKVFSKLSDSYLLGEGSKPHVTICQFYAQESEVEGIWKKASQMFTERSLHLDFNEVTSLVIHEKLWVQLIPEPNERLQFLHNQLAKMVESPLGLVFEAYSPHLTLANVRNAEREKAAQEVSALQLSLSDDFILSLGSCDEVGQFTGVLYGSNKSHADPGE